jgi:hypothetical protein
VEDSERAFVAERSAEMDGGLASWAAAKIEEFCVGSTLAVEIPDNRASPHVDKSVLSLVLCSDNRGGSAVRRCARLGAGGECSVGPPFLSTPFTVVDEGENWVYEGGGDPMASFVT